MKASKQLKLHLRLLKEECNKLKTLQDNGYKIKDEDAKAYKHHYNYVKSMLYNEIHLYIRKEIKGL